MPDRRAVRLEWTSEGMRFVGRGTEPPSPPVTVDGDTEAGPSPMLALLLAVAGCSGADVVSMLEKMRVRLEHCAVDVVGTRRDEHPKRYTALEIHYTLGGAGLDRAKAERAVELSLEKYCSVLHSLAPDIAVRSEITLG